jgi:outer membrane protein assembly factor BamB
VADGKVVTLGVRGILSCYEAATGKKLWRKDDVKGAPRFFTSCSPLIADGVCLVQLGGENSGAIVAYDLASGAEKWKWSGDGTAYASPMLLSLGADKVLVAETAGKIVGIGAADGKLLWQTPFAVTGRGYNAATPMVVDQTVIYSGTARGTKAVKLEKQAGGLSGKELWSNSENSVQYNTPVVKNGLLFGLSSNDNLFCINVQDGKTAWTAPIRGGSKRSGYGSIVDAGSVLLALTPSAQLIVYEPSDKEFKQLASYKVADGDTYAYPIVAGNRVFVKDRDSVILWTIE